MAGPDECWPWKLYRDRDGYGYNKWAGKNTGAHRIVFFLTHGIWPELVMHSCDNPPCCNPAHLLAGTQKLNALDRAAKGRGVRGHRVNTSKLTEDQIRDMRSRSISRGTKAALAREFGISKTSVGLILSGRHWKHLESTHG